MINKSSLTLPNSSGSRGADGCLKILQFIGMMIGWGAAWLGYKWLMVCWYPTDNYPLTTADKIGPWVLIILGALPTIFTLKSLIQSKSAPKLSENHDTEIKRNHDGSIDILPKGIHIKQSDIRALRFTSCSHGHNTNGPSHFRLYRLYLELMDGSLMFLSAEIAHRNTEMTNLEMYKNVIEIKNQLGIDLTVHLPEDPIAISTAPKKICFTLQSPEVNTLTNPLVLPQKMPSWSSLLPLFIFLIIFALIWIKVASGAPYMLLFGIPFFVFIIISVLTSRTLYVNFKTDNGGIEVALVRSILGFNYLTINYQCPRKAIENVRFTWDDEGYMVLLDLNNEAPPVKLIWQVIGYSIYPEKKSLDTNGTVFLLSAWKKQYTIEEMYSLYSRFKSILI